LPGWVESSFGYHADDGRFIAENGAGHPYGPVFSVGDTVGCGVSDNNELFFTKNGKFLGVATQLPIGADIYPLLGLDKGAVTSNFGRSPFMFPIHSTQLGSNNTSAVEGCNLPRGILHRIASFMQLGNLLTFSKCNKFLYNICRSNDIWKPIVHARWPTVSPYITVKSYYLFYQRRHKIMSEVKKSILVENCENWEFLCPLTLDRLQRTNDRGVDYCSVCNQNVYLVHNLGQLRQRAEAKQCVSIDFQKTEYRRRTSRKGGNILVSRR